MSLIENPSTNYQMALASLVALMALMALGIFAPPIIGVMDVTQGSASEWGFGLPLLAIGFGFFALLLMWWGHSLGPLSGIVSGILFLVNGIMSALDAASGGDFGGAPVGFLWISIPMILFSLVLLATSYMAWRE